MDSEGRCNSQKQTEIFKILSRHKTGVSKMAMKTFLLIFLLILSRETLGVQYFLREGNSTTNGLSIYIYDGPGKQLSFTQAVAYCHSLTEGVNFAQSTLPTVRSSWNQEDFDFMSAVGHKTPINELTIWINTIIIGSKCYAILVNEIANVTIVDSGRNLCSPCYASCCAIELNTARKMQFKQDCNIQHWTICQVATTKEYLQRTLSLLNNKVG